jgi:hypothetical protein
MKGSSSQTKKHPDQIPKLKRTLGANQIAEKTSRPRIYPDLERDRRE